MTSKLDRFDDSVWDRFLDANFEPVETMSREEVQAELKKRGLDVSAAISRVKAAVSRARAKAELADARERRQSVVEGLTNMVTNTTANLRNQIQNMIDGRLQGSFQAAYFRKLEKAAGEDDLQGLLDDIKRLESLAGDDEE